MSEALDDAGKDVAEGVEPLKPDPLALRSRSSPVRTMSRALAVVICSNL